MNEQEHLNTIYDIKNLMERSSRFLSLSGFSGVFTGLFALIGSAVAWLHINNNAASTEVKSFFVKIDPEVYRAFIPFLICLAVVILLLSITTSYVLTHRFTKKKGLHIWDASAKRLLINLFIPLITGGIYCLVLLYHGYLGLIVSTMLIFYGLALVNASKYTFNDIRYLGLAEIIIGLLASFLPGYSLLFWALGFGIMHIIYGISMYYNYER